jgi:hypothetical protein
METVLGKRVKGEEFLDYLKVRKHVITKAKNNEVPGVERPVLHAIGIRVFRAE